MKTSMGRETAVSSPIEMDSETAVSHIATKDYSMSDLGKNILKILGTIFALLVIGFTGVQTWSLLYEVSADPVTSTIGLVLFEGGMLYWWFVFQREAEGIFQMALSLLAAIFGLLLVIGATSLHLGAVEADLLGVHTPARLVTVAAVVNLASKFLFPLFEPQTFELIWERALEGRVMLKAYQQADSKVDDLAVELGDQVGNELVRRLQVRVLSGKGLNHGMSKPSLTDGGNPVIYDLEPEPEEAPVIEELDLSDVEELDEEAPIPAPLSENGHHPK